MLIFQLHLPHVIPNSMQAIHALSHSEIIERTTSLLRPVLHDQTGRTNTMFPQ